METNKDGKRRLKVSGRIGNGAFGVVYRGTYDGSPCAIKTIAHSEGCAGGDDIAFRMFSREAQVLRQCSHRNIIGFKSMCRLTPHKEAQGKWALVLELAQGGTLSDKVTSQMIHPGSKVYSNTDALNWCLDLAHALEYLHLLSPAVLHRDVKLGNVVLAKEEGQWVAKLSDFGLHVVVDGARHRVMRVSSSGDIKAVYLTPRMILAGAAGKVAPVGMNDSCGSKASEDIKAMILAAEGKEGDASCSGISSSGHCAPCMTKQKHEQHEQQPEELQQTATAAATANRNGPARKVSFTAHDTQHKQKSRPASRTSSFNGAPAGLADSASDTNCYAARMCDGPLPLNGSGYRRQGTSELEDDSRSMCGSMISDGTWVSDGTCMTNSTGGWPADSDYREEVADGNGNNLVETLYNMTGQTGSCMYMAPEVFLGQPYNEKADVFSIGVVLFEMMARCLLIFSELPTTTTDLAETERYAAKVSKGYRPKRPKHMSDEVWQLVEQCWQQEPRNRPSMTQVVSTLQSLLQAEAIAAGSKRKSFFSSTPGAPAHTKNSTQTSCAAAAPAVGGAVAAGAADRPRQSAAASDSPAAPSGCGCVIC